MTPSTHPPSGTSTPLRPDPLRDQTVTITSARTGRRYTHHAPFQIDIESPGGLPFKVIITEPIPASPGEDDGRITTIYDAVESFTFHSDSPALTPHNP